VAVFRQLELGDPLGFYDAIVTAGSAVEPGQVGTIGELASKPHPWLYAEAARIGLTVDRSNRQRVIGIEDSAAGVLAIRLAGFACIGLTFGNIAASGMRPLVAHECDSLEQALPTILGEDP
jgi:beta-phosphoglucomutase-like phosphatase (HAD superfamily)